MKVTDWLLVVSIGTRIALGVMFVAAYIDIKNYCDARREEVVQACRVADEKVVEMKAAGDSWVTKVVDSIKGFRLLREANAGSGTTGND